MGMAQTGPLQARRAAQSGTHGLQSRSQLGVLFLNLQLGPCGLGVRDGVDDLGLCPGQLGGSLEILQRLRNLALLQEELGDCSHGNVAFGIDYTGLVSNTSCNSKCRLTDEGLLAEIFGFLEVMLPLEDSERLVDERKDVDSHGLALFLHVHGLVELLDGLREVLLVEEELSEVVVDIRHVLKVLHRSLESGHGGCNGAHLVLRHTKLDVGENEVAVKFDRLLVVLGGVRKLPKNEVKLSAMVVDVGVVLVVSDSELKIVRCGILVPCPVLETKITRRRACRTNLAPGASWHA